MQNVFVYGSLLFPEIVTGLTGISFSSEQATLPHFKRCGIKEADYPAIIENDGTNVQGKILFDVNEIALKQLAFFEGEDYEILKATAFCNGEKVQVLLFCWIGPHSSLTNEDWDAELFENESLEYYTEVIIPATVKEYNRIFSDS
jgi:gamma-glutamylcyclotransferase (GGCT)/AIG2-like uncharacterized protein YtfP